MNLHENIDRIKSIMDEGKDAYISRARYDQEYEEEYPKWAKIMIKFLDMEINAYDENDNVLILFNTKNKGQMLMRYNKKNEALWWDYSLKDMLMKFVPYAYISRHYKYAVQDFFKKHFPQYGIREINGASIM
jgi:hypothetical protein